MSKPFSSILTLFNEARMLDEEHISAILSECGKRQITPGEFLFSSGAMKPEVIRAAILAQLLMKERLLTPSTAVKALQKVTALNCSLEEALDKCHWDRHYAEHVKLVADLLTASSIITREQKDEVLDDCLDNRIPLTNLLLEHRTIDEVTADFVLATLVLLKREAISFDQAVSLLKVTKGKACSLEEALESCAISQPESARYLKLGELLLASGLISVRQLMAGVEQGLFQRRRLGEILVSAGSVSQAALEAALQMQESLKKGLINAQDAITQLKLIHNPKG